MEGVQGEKGGREGARPEGAGEEPKQRHEQQGIDNMEGDIDQMVPPRIQAEDLYVHHMGDPGEGVPVVGMMGGKGPGDIVEREAGPYMGVFRDVFVVVEVDEGVMADLPVNRYGQEDNPQGDPEGFLLGPKKIVVSSGRAHRCSSFLTTLASLAIRDGSVFLSRAETATAP